MKKQIQLNDIIKLQHLFIAIFEQEDEDDPDYRIIRAKERTVNKILDSITKEQSEKIEIFNCIIRGSWNTEDNAFKTICDDLRELGYIIIKKEGKKDV